MRPRLRAAGGAWRGHCNLDPRPPGHPCGPSRRRGSWGSEGAWVAALHPRVEPRRPGIRVWLSTPGNRVLPGRTAPPDLETHRAPRAGAPRPAGRGGESPGCGRGNESKQRDEAAARPARSPRSLARAGPRAAWERASGTVARSLVVPLRHGPPGLGAVAQAARPRRPHSRSPGPARGAGPLRAPRASPGGPARRAVCSVGGFRP